MDGNLDMRQHFKPGRRKIMQARHDGTCSVCLRDILQGQNIEMTPDGAVHYGCRETDGEEEE